MLKSYNDNMVSSFFKAVADFWDGAVKYQIYVILSAMGLLLAAPFFGEKLSSTTNVVLNITIFCAVAAGGLALFKLKGSHLAAFTFAAALLLRLCLIFPFERPSPYMCNDDRVRTYQWIRHYDSALLQADEFFYAYHTQIYKEATISEFAGLPEFMKNSHRTSFLMSRILKFFGDEFVWLRIVGAFLGAFAAGVITLVAEELFKKNTSSIVSLLLVLAPQTAFYSVRFLKEIWVIFAASLIVFGFTAIIRNKKAFWAVLPILISVIILFWVRFEYGLMAVAAVPISVFFRSGISSVRKTVIIVPMIFLALIISFYRFNQLTDKVENVFDKYLLTESGQKGRVETIAILDKMYKSHGPLRLLNIPLSLLNPPPRSLQHIFAPKNGLYDIVLQADIWQWWGLLPFFIIGAIVIINKRTEFLVFLVPYTAIIIISAILHGGLLPLVSRFRDSLAPMAFIIIGAGIDSLSTGKKPWKNVIILSVYTTFVLLAIYLYARGF